jgi:hypothetical protein
VRSVIASCAIGENCLIVSEAFTVKLAGEGITPILHPPFILSLL